MVSDMFEDTRRLYLLLQASLFFANPLTCAWTCCILVVRLIAIKHPFYQIREKLFWYISLPATLIFTLILFGLCSGISWRYIIIGNILYFLYDYLMYIGPVIFTSVTIFVSIWTCWILMKNPSGSEEAGRLRRKAAVTAFLLMLIQLPSVSIYLIIQAIGYYIWIQNIDRETWFNFVGAAFFLYNFPFNSLLNPVVLYLRRRGESAGRPPITTAARRVINRIRTSRV